MSPHTDAGALLPCPFCGSSSVDPEGWMSCESDGSDKRTGPACDDCGASATSDERWNTRDWAPEADNTRQAASQGSGGGEREAIARIIEPNGFHLLDELAKPESDGFPNRGEAENLASRQADLAYTKADAILALTPAQAVTDRLDAEIGMLREKLSDALAGGLPHRSDCAVYQAPAYEPGPCNCGVGAVVDDAAYDLVKKIRGHNGWTYDESNAVNLVKSFLATSSVPSASRGTKA